MRCDTTAVHKRHVLLLLHVFSHTAAAASTACLHPHRFIWLLVLPFGIFPEASWWAMVPVSVMALMMLGLEDATAQMEDPFKFIAYGEFHTCFLTGSLSVADARAMYVTSKVHA